MIVRGDWRKDTLHACRLAIPPLVAVLVVIGVFRIVSFMKVYGAGHSVGECLWLARSLGQLESLAAPFLVAAVWVAVYPVLVGLRWVLHSHGRGRAHRPVASSAASPRSNLPATPSPTTGAARRTPRKSPAA